MPEPKLHRYRVKILNVAQRQLLIDHIDGEVPMVPAEVHRVTTKFAMRNAGFLKFLPPNSPRPRATALTNLGREAVCMILGEYADALTKAKAIDFPDSIAALRKLLFAGQEPAKNP